MRFAWFFILGVFLMGNVSKEELFVIKQKEIRVKGVTTIGKFECSYGNEKLSDSLYLGKLSESRQIYFTIPVEQFGCGNFLLNRDFRNTLKADQYPVCQVTVKSMERGDDRFFSDIDVSLAGKELEFKDMVFRQEGSKLVGEIDLSFEELELRAPKKMGGLIQVDDCLSLQIIMGM